MPNIFCSTPINGGYSWTITSKLGDILLEAENRYGNRDQSYTILGVELTVNDHPQVWYPKNCNNIIIQITANCLDDMNRAVFQVAHEAIHCLSPSGGRNANVLEEGLADYFSIEYTKMNGHGAWSSSLASYQEASILVEQLLIIDQGSIKKARLIQPTLSLITKEVLMSINSNIPNELAEKLVSKFVR
jgi:hypothetical protein